MKKAFFFILFFLTSSAFSLSYPTDLKGVLGKGEFLLESVSQDQKYHFKIYSHMIEVWDFKNQYQIKTLTLQDPFLKISYFTNHLVLEWKNNSVSWNLLGDALKENPKNKGQTLTPIKSSPSLKESFYLLALSQDFILQGNNKGSVLLQQKPLLGWVALTQKPKNLEPIKTITYLTQKKSLVYQNKDININFLLTQKQKVQGVFKQGIELDHGFLTFYPSLPQFLDFLNQPQWESNKNSKTLTTLSLFFPQNLHFSYQAGLVKLDLQDYAGAEILLRKALRQNPKNKEYQEALGLSLFFQKKNKQALNILKNLNTAQSYFYTGILYYLSKNNPLAIQSFRKAIGLNPQNEKSYNNLFLIYREQKRMILAERILLEGIKANPEEPTLFYHLGILMQDIKKPILALLAYEKALTLSPHNKEIAGQLYFVYQQLGLSLKALELLKKVLEVYPQDPTSHYNIALLYRQQKNYPLAYFHFEAFLSFSKDENLKKRVELHLKEILSAISSQKP